MKSPKFICFILSELRKSVYLDRISDVNKAAHTYKMKMFKNICVYRDGEVEVGGGWLDGIRI